MRVLTSGIGFLMLAACVSAQAIPPGNYLSQLPPIPKLVTQTEASARLHLYGDVRAPSYRDLVPLDGMDDERGAQLSRLAYRFAPILRRNNFSAPRDFRQAMGGRLVMRIDIWENGELVRQDSLLLEQPLLAKASTDSLPSGSDLFRELVQRYAPTRPEKRVVS